MTEIVVEVLRCGRIVWTQELDGIVRDCLRKRMTRSQIGKLLGLTRNTIAGRIDRLRKAGQLDVY